MNLDRKLSSGSGGAAWRAWFRLALTIGTLGWPWSLPAAGPPAEWKNLQALRAEQPGLLKLSLPVETLGACRSQLEDLRVFDPQGRETPYLIEPSLPADKFTRSPGSFRVSLQPSATVITLEAGLSQPIEEISLETPASSFIKAVQVEGSRDGTSWRQLAQGLPIFRQTAGPSQLRLPLTPEPWAYLRLTVDDRRSEAIPFSGARLTAATAPVPTEPVAVTIAERAEGPGQTRLVLALPAANLRLASLQIEATDPLFTREVTVAGRRIVEDGIQEFNLASGLIYRLAVEGQPASAGLDVGVESVVPGRELVLLIQNHDSPPLQIAGVKAARRPVYLVFHAAAAGVYQLLSGNNQCAAPRYDVASLAANLKAVPVSPLTPGPLSLNTAYRAPEALPSIQDTGAALDVADWKCRKAVRLAKPGVQRLDLDLEVLARAQPGLHDLRLLRDDKQLAFVLERTSLLRAVAPAVSSANDPKRATLSRWSFRLPHPRLPLVRLVCSSGTTLFQREISLYEEAADERGSKYQRPLGHATWVCTPERPGKQLVVELQTVPETDSLFLETDNGDNPSIVLSGFQFFYYVNRLSFKSDSREGIHLYYACPEARAPRYDLSLVANQLLAAEKSAATLGPEEQLKRASWREQLGTTGGGGPIFWGALILVVVGLLLAITRLIPKSTPMEPPPPSQEEPPRQED